MSYNPKIHHRRSIRLKGYDYSQAGCYFITICCQDRICRFGHVENNEMILNEFEEIAHQEWIKLAERFPNFELDVFQIMPNHIHGIIVLNHPTVGSTLAVDPTVDPTVDPNETQSINPKITIEQIIINQNNIDNQYIKNPINLSPKISDIVGAYKSLVANGCLNLWKLKWTDVKSAPTMGKLWQRNYYEHIIRNEQSYQNISNYIINNPAKWNQDKFHH